MTEKLRAAVIGLGQVGSRFDADPQRQAVWTHVGAYLALSERFDLVAACDNAAENAAHFSARCPGVPVFAEATAMLAAARPDVVSICTPAPAHEAVLARVLAQTGVKAVWCEKPLADNLSSARAMVEAAEARGVKLIVSYVRRWTPLWREVARIVASGRLGTVRSIRIAMPNRLMSIGSHAVDLALYLGGRPSALRGLAIPGLAQDDEPAVAALLAFGDQAIGVIQVTGRKDALIVEAEVIGDAGRLSAREDRSEILIETFAPSARYEGYRELRPGERVAPDESAEQSPFVAIAAELDDLVRGRVPRATCDGRDALAVQQVLNELMREAA